MKNTFVLAVALIVSALSLNAVAGGDIVAGKAALADKACVSCHGADFNTPIDANTPKIAGQYKDYLEHALTAYQRGKGPNGRNNAIMGPQVEKLTRQEIRDIAAYIASLPGPLVVK